MRRWPRPARTWTGPDGLIDGHDGEQVLTALVHDGVRSMICQARGGFAGDDDPQLQRPPPAAPEPAPRGRERRRVGPEQPAQQRHPQRDPAESRAAQGGPAL